MDYVIPFAIGAILCIPILMLNGYLARFPRFLRLDSEIGIAVNLLLTVFTTAISFLTGNVAYLVGLIVPGATLLAYLRDATAGVEQDRDQE